MMNTVETNIALAGLTTFGIAATAQQLVRVEIVADVREVLKAAEAASLPLTVRGGGSNVLLTRDVQGLVMKMEIMGRRVVREDADHVDVEFGAGEVWHDAVTWTVEQGWGGLENLALIPGTVGAAPMQRLNLALQGGGSHGALTWGVLDALLEDGRWQFEGVSGTSAGAMACSPP